MHKRGAILAHQLREAMAAVRNLRLRLWDARPEWVDLEAAADHGSLGVARSANNVGGAKSAGHRFKRTTTTFQHGKLLLANQNRTKMVT